jgi:4,5-dihydroxyphthalate decarboxylase
MISLVEGGSAWVFLTGLGQRQDPDSPFSAFLDTHASLLLRFISRKQERNGHLMTTSSLVLKTAIGNYGNTKALKDGTVTVPGISFDFVEISPVNRAFRPMVERLEFDVSEMAVTTYMLAKHFGKQLTALPIVLMRIFHHGTILCNARSGIREPKDLEGRRVGLRAYAQTGPTWSRGILQNEYGVDLGKVTWVTFEGSHVSEFQDPGNAVRAPEGKKITDMLLSGEIDAAIGADRVDSPEVRPLFAQASNVEAEWFRKTGIYPLNHIVVIKSGLASSHPWVLGELFRAFKTAKEFYLGRLNTQGPSSADDELKLRLKRIVGGDPLPYGVLPNRKAIETLAQFVFQQKVLPRLYRVEELFDPAVMDLE